MIKIGLQELIGLVGMKGLVMNYLRKITSSSRDLYLQGRKLRTRGRVKNKARELGGEVSDCLNLANDPSAGGFLLGKDSLLRSRSNGVRSGCGGTNMNKIEAPDGVRRNARG